VGRLLDRGGGAGEEVARRRRTLIHRPSDEIPQRGRALPFVEENGCGSLEHASRVRGGQGELSRIVELSNGRGSPDCRGRLADAFGPLEGEGGESGKKLVQLVVDQMAGLLISTRDLMVASAHIGTVPGSVRSP
jgi:hypothetical protein